MRDLVLVAGTAAFFALCVAYVALCDQIIGPDPADSGDAAVADQPQELTF
jgi:hypothetical protein